MSAILKPDAVSFIESGSLVQRILQTQARLDKSAADTMQLLTVFHENFLTPKTVRDLVDERLGEEYVRLTKLRDDAIAVLEVLVEAGVVTRERLNEAVRSGD